MGGRHGRSRSHRGQTLIEFALVAPLALFFLLAIVDFGIAIDRRVVLQHAVREGARYAAVGGDALTSGTPASVPEIRQHTANQSQGIANGTATSGNNYIEVCYENSNSNGTLGDAGDNVRVRIHYEYNFVTGLTSWIAPSLTSIVMKPDANARVEQAQTTGATACG